MTEGERILFAIPWGSRVILGTTDTDYDGSLEDVPVDASDVSYVLSAVNRAFPAGTASAERRDLALGRHPAADCSQENAEGDAFRYLAEPPDRHARAGLDRRGRGQAHDLPPHGGADGRPDRPASELPTAPLPHRRRAADWIPQRRKAQAASCRRRSRGKPSSTFAPGSGPATWTTSCYAARVGVTITRMPRRSQTK